MTFGNPWDCNMLRNSNVSCAQSSLTGNKIGNSQGRTISKPNEPSIMRRTKSTTLPMSIMELMSLLHSMKVIRRLFPPMTVIGPFASCRVCFAYRRTRLLRRVVFPTPGGPTIATMTGGGVSSGVLSTKGTCRRVWSRSTFLRPCLSARLPDLGAKAWVAGGYEVRDKQCTNHAPFR